MVYGADAIGATAQQSCDLAQRLAARVDSEPELSAWRPWRSTSVSSLLRRRAGTGRVECRAIVADLHEDGVAAPSSTVLDGRLAICAAIVNHRTRPGRMSTAKCAAPRGAGRDRRGCVTLA